jgi:hypothetical protein
MDCEAFSMSFPTRLDMKVSFPYTPHLKSSVKSLYDFKAIDSPAESTADHYAFGSPVNMSSEQIAGQFLRTGLSMEWTTPLSFYTFIFQDDHVDAPGHVVTPHA